MLVAKAIVLRKSLARKGVPVRVRPWPLTQFPGCSSVWSACLIWIQEVEGSNPSIPITYASVAQLEGRPTDISEGSDMYVKTDGQVVFIDTTAEYEMDDEDQTKERARMRELSDMFKNAYVDVNDSIETCEYETIINDSVHDIDARIRDAENNLKALKKLIDIVKRARDNGATHLAVVDFNDFDKYGEDD